MLKVIDDFLFQVNGGVIVQGFLRQPVDQTAIQVTIINYSLN